MCTRELHEQIKADTVKWSTEATPIAPEPLFGLEWKNCNACHSTLVKPVSAAEVQS